MSIREMHLMVDFGSACAAADFGSLVNPTPFPNPSGALFGGEGRAAQFELVKKRLIPLLGVPKHFLE